MTGEAVKRGDRSDEVKRWQVVLGMPSPSGYFCATTRTLTRRWQRERELEANGVVDAKTWEAVPEPKPEESPKP